MYQYTLLTSLAVLQISWSGSRSFLLDDRIHFFVDLYGYKSQHYYYAMRAVSPGNYKMGPVSADAMYNEEYHSYNGAGVVKVLQ